MKPTKLKHTFTFLGGGNIYWTETGSRRFCSWLFWQSGIFIIAVHFWDNLIKYNTVIMFGYLYFPMFVTGLANSNADNIHSQTRHRGRGLCNFHQIIQHDSGIQFTNAHFSEKLFSIFMFFSFYFYQFRYIYVTLFFTHTKIVNLTMLSNFALHL